LEREEQSLSFGGLELRALQSFASRAMRVFEDGVPRLNQLTRTRSPLELMAIPN
jgi:hypothetical protein